MNDLPRFHQLQRGTRFTFVRHGESEANKAGIVQGRHNAPLSAAGREHARAAGRWLRGEGVDLLFTSPLDRSLQTARLVAEAVGISEPITLDELIEIDTGVYSGQSISEQAKSDPAQYAAFRMQSWEGVEGAEKRDSILRRAHIVWERLVSEANSGSRHVACVTHGGMLQWLIKATLGGSDHRWMPLFSMANCGVSTFHAESTSLDHEGEVEPGTGYYGSWKPINHVPY